MGLFWKSHGEKVKVAGKVFRGIILIFMGFYFYNVVS